MAKAATVVLLALAGRVRGARDTLGAALTLRTDALRAETLAAALARAARGGRTAGRLTPDELEAMGPEQQMQAIGAMTPEEKCAFFVEGSTKPVSKSGGVKECACETSGHVLGTEFGEEATTPGAEYGDDWWYFYTENSYKCMPKVERRYREAMMDILHVEEFANGNPSLHFKKVWYYSMALASAGQPVRDASRVPLDDPADASQFDCGSREDAVPDLGEACNLAKQALQKHPTEATECLETIRSLEFAQAANIVDAKDMVKAMELVTETARALKEGSMDAAVEKAKAVFETLVVMLGAVRPTVEANVPPF